MKFELNGREVEIVETQFERGEGVYVTGATYVDTGADLTDDECDKLASDYQETLYEDACIDQCADAYDRYKDHMKYGDM
jgi:hypothetical protein